MKKKLTKEQLKERKEKLNKFLRISLYVSLAFNTLFAVLFAYGCATSKSSVSARTYQGDHYRQNAVNDFNSLVNGATKVYDLNSFIYENNTFTRNSSGGVSLSTNTSLLLFGGSSQEDYSGITRVDASIRIDNPIQQNNNVVINAYHDNTLLGAIEWEYLPYEQQTQNGWVCRHTGTTATGWYLGVNSSFIHDNYGVNYDVFVSGIFEEVEYRDLDLSNWDIFNKYPLKDNSATTPSSSRDLEIVTKSMFAVEGRFYDRVRLHYGGTGTRVSYDGNPNNSSIADYGCLEFVSFYNSESLQRQIVWLYDVQYNDSGDGVYMFGKFVCPNNNHLNLRLFGINLVDTGVYEIFTYSSSMGIQSSDGQFGDVFGLIRTAFNGLTSILSITILPGISLGLLIFVPFIGFIVFAIIRVIKK